MSPWLFVGAAVLAFAASLGGTMVVRRYAVRRGLLDHPNERSSHTIPTPRGGGLPAIVVCLTLVALSWIAGFVDVEVAMAFVIGGAFTAGVAFVDDHRHIRAAYRLLSHLLVGAWVAYFLGAPDVELPGVGPMSLGWVGLPLVALFVAWSLNLFNFMDGIDGLAGSEAAFVSLAGAAISLYVGEPSLAWIFVVIGAASIGFLFWNWPPAKIFMGDVGSGTIGFLFAVMALALPRADRVTVFPMLILLGVFVIDATVTLLARMVRRNPWYLPHRTHAYQHAAIRYGHRAVTLAIWGINLLILLPAAWAAVLHPGWGLWLSLGTQVPLTLLALYFDAGHDETKRFRS